MGVFTVEVAVGRQLVAEHIADARCRAARAAVLIEYGREVSVQSVVYVVGALTRTTLAR